MTARRVLALAVLLAFAAAPARAGFLPSPAGETVSVPTRPGVTERYLLWRPDGAPKAVALMLIGGEGVANIRDNMPLTFAQTGNFLPRSREYFRRRGFAVAVVDAPSDHRGGLLANFRLTADHAEDIAGAIADLRRRVPGVPVWLIGTSRGTISAASVGARVQGSRGADGVVLTSSVTRSAGAKARSPDHVFDVDLAAIRVPVLVVYHRQDSCFVVSPADGAQIIRKLSNAPKTDMLVFDGGDPPRSGPCEPLAPHGFWGIEETVVNAIADWILAAKP